MATKKARIRVEVTGAKQLQKILRGIREGEKRGSREDRQRDKRKTADEAQEEQKRSRTRKRHRDQNLTDEQRAARIKRLIERDVTREVEQQARQRARAERQAARERASSTRAQRVGRTLMRGTAAVVGGAFGAANVVGQRLDRARGAIGVSSTEERIQGFMRAEQNFIRLAAQGGLAPERRQELWGQIGETARETNTDPEAIIEALTVAQNRFSDLDGFAQNIERIAEVAQVTGSPMADWVGALGEFQRQMGVASTDLPDLIGMVTQAARDGSIEAGDIAANFAGIMSSFVSLRGGKNGMEQAREFMGVSEVMGAGGRTPEETRTLVTNLMTALRRDDVQRGIERATGNREIFDRDGVMRVSMADLAAQMSEARGDAFRSPAKMRRAGIRDAEAQAAIDVLMNQFVRGDSNNPIANIAAADAGAANRMIDQTMVDLKTSASGEAMGLDIAGRVAMMQNGEQVVRTITDMVRPLEELTAQYPLAVEAVSTFVEAVQAAGLGIAASNLLGLGTSAAPLGSSATPALGAAAPGVGAAPVLAAVGGAALAGQAAYELQQGLSRAATPDQVRRIRESEGSDAARRRARGDFEFMRQGALGQGMAAFAPGMHRAIEVFLSPDSRQALEAGIARAAGAQSARTPGGPARRGGG
ncbi:MAG: hypothetical protein MUE69_30310 [Myxococcota bacterium]|nr:hypothetical protein [Myxococcota bacterium]